MRAAIKTASGAYFDFLNPASTPLSIEDIATGLSNTCRFAGQLDTFYSVAQHSWLVSHLVPPELAFAGLMHDCAEAVMHDITAPLKQLLPDYQKIAHRVEVALMCQFNVQWHLPEVKAADLKALATEKRDITCNQCNADDYWQIIDGIEPLVGHITPWPAKAARAMFLERFAELSPR